MQQLEITHPDVYSEFAAENHFIKAVQGSPFPKLLLTWPIDQRRLKVKLQRWFLTIHEQASITSALKAVYGLQDGEQALHKEAAPTRVKRDEEDVKKMKGCWLNDRNVYSRLGYAYYYYHRSSSATLNLEPSSVLRAIPNIFPVSFFCRKNCINKKRCGPEPCPQCRQRPAANAFVRSTLTKLTATP